MNRSALGVGFIAVVLLLLWARHNKTVTLSQQETVNHPTLVLSPAVTDYNVLPQVIPGLGTGTNNSFNWMGGFDASCDCEGGDDGQLLILVQKQPTPLVPHYIFPSQPQPVAPKVMTYRTLWLTHDKPRGYIGSDGSVFVYGIAAAGEIQSNSVVTNNGVGAAAFQSSYDPNGWKFTGGILGTNLFGMGALLGATDISYGGKVWKKAVPDSSPPTDIAPIPSYSHTNTFQWGWKGLYRVVETSFGEIIYADSPNGGYLGSQFQNNGNGNFIVWEGVRYEPG